MSVYLYLSSSPEALVGSMLPPEDFGRYLALGAGKRTHTQALFFEVDRDAAAEDFDLAGLDRKCIAHNDGSPHRSSYVSIYRVIERLPLRALKKLYLTTRDGTTIGLDPGDPAAFKPRQGFHLYQEFCPIMPLVVSSQSPREFSQSITNPENAVFVPRILFADFRLNELASDPRAKAELPYREINHIQFCLEELNKRPGKVSKIVVRNAPNQIQYWMIENGFFVADNEEMAFFPMPSEEELRTRNPEWWSSARAVELM